jgi:hypothetical protein
MLREKKSGENERACSLYPMPLPTLGNSHSTYPHKEAFQNTNTLIITSGQKDIPSLLFPDKIKLITPLEIV